MLDLQAPHVEHHMMIRHAELMNPLFFPIERALTIETPSQEELFKIAENYQECFANSTDWSCFSKLTIDSYHYLSRFKNLSTEEVKAHVVTILDHFIDITDTPWLPDEYTDPLFKALIPSLVDMLSGSLALFTTQIITAETTTLSEAQITLFVEEIKATFADGIQLSDIPACINATLVRLKPFFFVDSSDKKHYVLQIVDALIDAISIPGFGLIIHPIAKYLTHPFIETMFRYLTL